MDRKIAVLFVDDDPLVRETYLDALPERSFAPFAVGDGREALRVLRQKRIDVLVTYIVMPGLDGIELAARARAIVPNLQVIFVTGYLSNIRDVRRIGRVLYKPVRAREIETAVRACIAKRR